jgi:hypothetical protein
VSRCAGVLRPVVLQLPPGPGLGWALSRLLQSPLVLDLAWLWSTAGAAVWSAGTHSPSAFQPFWNMSP